jgi:hypothetical protein
MNQENERRALALIRTVANRCERCLRRSRENCRNCLSAWANSILRDIEAEKSSGIDYSFGARMLRIINILKKAEKPLLASEIDLSGYCTRQLKRWTLLRMLDRGMLSRRVVRRTGKNVFYGYFLKDHPKGDETK